ncbi:hypothetical protein LEMA_P079980.1 [Plenodomus lingam JN3]|uniref:Neutral protease 2 n=1 Tax=Leptosphaeria maculans (strain JN3 / isolate v23.1.3 / race Av1-4-5-6-7-8) TaxID=985895 RepID=E5A561_LEPMJ|nr:hypothetical protein LEMA_P079980.1 [Plenodomus lingam JN3]CBX98759.1 hypothetical protein LEMA_P079980.1 [Plenodomus lingam JN3]
MKITSQLLIAALASYSAGASVDVNKRETSLTVELSAAGNSEVKVKVTNTGAKAVNLLSKGTFLDEELPVEKVSIYSKGGSEQVPFEGIKVRLLTTGLSKDDFVTLAAGETKETTIETAALHSLNNGGDFEVFAKGLLPFAAEGSTKLSGSLNYESNKLTMSVDGALAATVRKALDKRTVIGSSCTGSKLTTIRTALSNCARLASSAASAASAGTKLNTYFKSTTSSTRNTVSNRLTAVSSDCGGTGSKTTTNCNDPYGGCSSNVLAYTVPSQNFITYCPLFFNELPALTSTCHGQDQATTVLHEETHAPGVYSPGTDDLGYGYAAATALSTSQALNNADSFALYANATMKSTHTDLIAVRTNSEDDEQASNEMFRMQDCGDKKSNIIKPRRWMSRPSTWSFGRSMRPFPWRTTIIVLSLPLSLSLIVTLAAAAEMVSQQYILGRNCYPNGMWKEQAGATWRIMDSSYFFTPNLSFGTFTFTQVKVVDVAWDLIIGRGGQMLLAWVNYRVFNEWLVYHIITV